VDALGLDDGTQQRAACAIAVAGAQPVRGDLPARRTRGLGRLGDRPVQRAPAHPRHVRVQRLAREAVAERARPDAALARQPAVEQLGHTLGTGERADQVQIE
jgi:hypothetical protein